MLLQKLLMASARDLDLPILRSLLWCNALQVDVVKDLACHASQLFDVLGKVAGDELLAA